MNWELLVLAGTIFVAAHLVRRGLDNVARELGNRNSIIGHVFRRTALREKR